MRDRQAGFRFNRVCMDNVYSLNEIVQGRSREFFLDNYTESQRKVWSRMVWMISLNFQYKTLLNLN